MKRANEIRSDPSSGDQEKPAAMSKRKGSTSKGSTKTSSSNKDESTSSEKKSNVVEANHKKAEEDSGDNFEGDYFKDFYYAQGDYRSEAVEEEKDLQHAAERDEHEEEISQDQKNTPEK